MMVFARRDSGQFPPMAELTSTYPFYVGVDLEMPQWEPSACHPYAATTNRYFSGGSAEANRTANNRGTRRAMDQAAVSKDIPRSDLPEHVLLSPADEKPGRPDQRPVPPGTYRRRRLHPVMAWEAIAVGYASALQPDDIIVFIAIWEPF